MLPKGRAPHHRRPPRMRTSSRGANRPTPPPPLRPRKLPGTTSRPTRSPRPRGQWPSRRDASGAAASPRSCIRAAPVCALHRGVRDLSEMPAARDASRALGGGFGRGGPRRIGAAHSNPPSSQTVPSGTLHALRQAVGRPKPSTSGRRVRPEARRSRRRGRRYRFPAGERDSKGHHGESKEAAPPPPHPPRPKPATDDEPRL